MPKWYSIDRFIEYAETVLDGEKTSRPVVDRAPYLIPIVGDWKNRPGAYPWNPNGTSRTLLPDDAMRKNQEKLGTWQPEHGGYQVHFDKLVFAGTWCRTFTRMTSMEAACESARHAVNAILDHYIYRATDCSDARKVLTLPWRMPFGFVDQELSSPVRMPTPAGDYCFVYDCENREPADARPTRVLDSQCFEEGLPHPWNMWGIDQAAVATSRYRIDANLGSLYDPTAMIDQLRRWRQMVETLYGQPPTGAAPKARSAEDEGAAATGPAAGLVARAATAPEDDEDEQPGDGEVPEVPPSGRLVSKPPRDPNSAFVRNPRAYGVPGRPGFGPWGPDRPRGIEINEGWGPDA
jgi:hypothetical protein